MSRQRTVKAIHRGTRVLEGAGVQLRRLFGFQEAGLFDPFLLFDDFRSDRPEHYLKGFPWHPHRGIETITYVIAGEVEHGDSLGNSGVIGAGDVQWMTAGSGIIHQEMPAGDRSGRMYGFQLWANLPAAGKMMDPRYRDVTAAQIPTLATPDGTLVRIIAGTAGGKQGPVRDIVTDPSYLDISVPAGGTFEQPVERGHTAFVYCIEGDGEVAPGTGSGGRIADGELVLFTDGDAVTVSAGGRGVRFLCISGKPIGEPVAWRGPIVMNTQEELERAFEEYRNNTFIKRRG
ncbi:pirin family protein [bacterium]|nr:pirin family protein [bacterium]